MESSRSWDDITKEWLQEEIEWVRGQIRFMKFLYIKSALGKERAIVKHITESLHELERIYNELRLRDTEILKAHEHAFRWFGKGVKGEGLRSCGKPKEPTHSEPETMGS